ncbi:MAG TPA: RidA family protein [Methylomirabilota bacterium]|jgi:enamine deaminase RidA (YjgF/YER057c/UK114 family)|nr:RidA family protein [Methylomirabilota bacterium]
MGAEARLKELGIDLPPVSAPMANYVRSVRVGNLLFLAGHGPQKDGKMAFVGKLGRDLTVEQGAQAARLVGLNLLASTREALGSLDRVRRIVKVLGMVNSADGFGDQPKVMNGFSDFMVEVFGAAGRHARSAVGMAELPVGIAVEIEMIVEVADGAGTSGTGKAAAPRKAPSRGRRPAPRATPRRRR